MKKGGLLSFENNLVLLQTISLLNVENNLVMLQTKAPVLSKLVQEEDLGSPHKQIDHHSGGSQGSETEGILL